MSDDAVCVYVCNGLPNGELIKSYLEAYGIPAYIYEESLGRSYSLTVGPLSEVRIMVASKNADEALEILRGLDKPENEDEVSDEGNTD